MVRLFCVINHSICDGPFTTTINLGPVPEAQDKCHAISTTAVPQDATIPPTSDGSSSVPTSIGSGYFPSGSGYSTGYIPSGTGAGLDIPLGREAHQRSILRALAAGPTSTSPKTTSASRSEVIVNVPSGFVLPSGEVLPPGYDFHYRSAASSKALPTLFFTRILVLGVNAILFLK